jgi:hypothetical protein
MWRDALASVGFTGGLLRLQWASGRIGEEAYDPAVCCPPATFDIGQGCCFLTSGSLRCDICMMEFDSPYPHAWLSEATLIR